VKKPTQIRIDVQSDAGYVRYTDEPIVNTIDVWKHGQVAADIDAQGEVVGIELLGFDAPTIANAVKFATDRGLLFPSHLAAAVPA